MIHKIITKIFSTLDNLKWKSYYQMCIKRGLKLNKNVVLRNGIDFGSEPYLIEIGNNSRVSSGAMFITHSGGQYIMRKMKGYENVRIFGRIKIGNDTFIGARVTINHSVEIGNNCIVATGSVVNSSIPNNCVYGGIPAKYICTTTEYYDRQKEQSVDYPRKLEANRPKLDEYIKENLPHHYKPIRK